MARKKMDYPQNRRRPVKHRVSNYMRRDGTRISGHYRGSGVRSQRSRVVSKTVGAKEDSTPIGLHAFTVNFTYGPDDGESVVVFSDNYEDATDEGWEERIDTRTPVSVEIVDPSIGAALSWMMKKTRAGVEYGLPKITKATKLGAKYAVRGGVKGIRAGASVAKESYRLAAFGVQSKLVENLLRLCYQHDKAKRIAARASLKARYPDIYSQCDFSR